jgi:hypothetical protein
MMSIYTLISELARMVTHFNNFALKFNIHIVYNITPTPYPPPTHLQTNTNLQTIPLAPIILGKLQK